jgi:hypothetical protein
MSEPAVLVVMLVIACCAFVLGRAFESWAWRDAARFHERRCSGGKSFIVTEESLAEPSPVETTPGQAVSPRPAKPRWPDSGRTRRRTRPSTPARRRGPPPSACQ